MILSSRMLNIILNTTNWHTAAEEKSRSIAPNTLSVIQKEPVSVIEAIRSSGLFAYFVSAVNGIDNKEIYVSQVHGRAHLERVCLLAFSICLMEKLPASEVALVLEMAKYHDMGRINDRRDPAHGFRSAEKYCNLNRISNRDDLMAILTVISAHCVSDAKFDLVFEHYFGSDKAQYDRVFHMYQIIKDADGLDRFRLGEQQLDCQMLRLECSRQIVRFAYVINHIQGDSYE